MGAACCTANPGGRASIENEGINHNGGQERGLVRPGSRAGDVASAARRRGSVQSLQGVEDHVYLQPPPLQEEERSGAAVRPCSACIHDEALLEGGTPGKMKSCPHVSGRGPKLSWPFPKKIPSTQHASSSLSEEILEMASENTLSMRSVIGSEGKESLEEDDTLGLDGSGRREDVASSINLEGLDAMEQPTPEVTSPSLSLPELLSPERSGGGGSQPSSSSVTPPDRVRWQTSSHLRDQSAATWRAPPPPPPPPPPRLPLHPIIDKGKSVAAATTATVITPPPKHSSGKSVRRHRGWADLLASPASESSSTCTEDSGLAGGGGEGVGGPFDPSCSVESSDNDRSSVSTSHFRGGGGSKVSAILSRPWRVVGGGVGSSPRSRSVSLPSELRPPLSPEELAPMTARALAGLDSEEWLRSPHSSGVMSWNSADIIVAKEHHHHPHRHHHRHHPHRHPAVSRSVGDSFDMFDLSWAAGHQIIRASSSSPSLGYAQPLSLTVASATPKPELERCCKCRRYLAQRSPMGALRLGLVSGSGMEDMGVVAVLLCGHVFHSECLEQESMLADPPCPECNGGKPLGATLLAASFQGSGPALSSSPETSSFSSFVRGAAVSGKRVFGSLRPNYGAGHRRGGGWSSFHFGKPSPSLASGNEPTATTSHIDTADDLNWDERALSLSLTENGGPGGSDTKSSSTYHSSSFVERKWHRRSFDGTGTSIARALEEGGSATAGAQTKKRWWPLGLRSSSSSGAVLGLPPKAETVTAAKGSPPLDDSSERSSPPPPSKAVARGLRKGGLRIGLSLKPPTRIATEV